MKIRDPWQLLLRVSDALSGNEAGSAPEARIQGGTR
jgi:hypothetical protein